MCYTLTILLHEFFSLDEKTFYVWVDSAFDNNWFFDEPIWQKYTFIKFEIIRILVWFGFFV